METYGAMRAVTAVRVLTGEEEEEDAPEFGCDVTVEVDLKRLALLDDDDDEKEESIEAISKVRTYAGYGTLRDCLKRVARAKRMKMMKIGFRFCDGSSSRRRCRCIVEWKKTRV